MREMLKIFSQYCRKAKDHAHLPHRAHCYPNEETGFDLNISNTVCVAVPHRGDRTLSTLNSLTVEGGRSLIPAHR